MELKELNIVMDGEAGKLEMSVPRPRFFYACCDLATQNGVIGALVPFTILRDGILSTPAVGAERLRLEIVGYNAEVLCFACGFPIHPLEGDWYASLLVIDYTAAVTKALHRGCDRAAGTLVPPDLAKLYVMNGREVGWIS